MRPKLLSRRGFILSLGGVPIALAPGETYASSSLRNRYPTVIGVVSLVSSSSAVVRSDDGTLHKCLPTQKTRIYAAPNSKSISAFHIGERVIAEFLPGEQALHSMESILQFRTLVVSSIDALNNMIVTEEGLRLSLEGRLPAPPELQGPAKAKILPGQTIQGLIWTNPMTATSHLISIARIV